MIKFKVPRSRTSSLRGRQNSKFKIKENGAILILTVVFTALFLIIGGGMLSLINYQLKLSRFEQSQAIALHIADAGVNYYRWHLAHAQNDFADGTGQVGCNPCGPYEHSFESIGKFSLEITPPPVGSSVVKIKSTGWTNKQPNAKRYVVAQYGIPSLARFSFLTNTNVWFGQNESVVGPMHSNGGARMDGTNNNSVTSAKQNYTCGADHGCDQANCNNPCSWIGYCQCPGIWGSGIDNNLWNYPVPNINYDSLAADLNQIKTDAESGGLCIGDGGPNCNTGGNSNVGFHITLKSNGTIDLYRISSLRACLNQLNDDWTAYTCKSEQINAEVFQGNFPMPGNGLIYVEGNLWIDGVINGRLTIAAAQLPGNPNTYKNVYINGNLTYLTRDGNHSLGLMSQNNIWVPRYAPTDLVIDGMLTAQNGHVARNLYASRLVQNSIEVYGGIMTNKIWTWTWVNSGGQAVDGYNTTRSIYDPNLTYSPPPSFPTSGEYEFISWEEILVGESY